MIYVPLQVGDPAARGQPEPQQGRDRRHLPADADRGRDRAGVAASCAGCSARRTTAPATSRMVVPAELLAEQRRTQRIFELVMVAIASISLLVGGIGIMNIMLASVLERTREIGVRRAVGARRRDIVRQFLIEATMISCAGGVVGVVAGVALSWIIGRLAGWTTVVSLGVDRPRLLGLRRDRPRLRRLSRPQSRHPRPRRSAALRVASRSFARSLRWSRLRTSKNVAVSATSTHGIEERHEGW